jgi:hypothetical protein
MRASRKRPMPCESRQHGRGHLATCHCSEPLSVAARRRQQGAVWRFLQWSFPVHDRDVTASIDTMPPRRRLSIPLLRRVSSMTQSAGAGLSIPQRGQWHSALPCLASSTPDLRERSLVHVLESGFGSLQQLVSAPPYTWCDGACNSEWQLTRRGVAGDAWNEAERGEGCGT